MFFSELYQFSCELKKLILLFVTLPAEPTDLIVLAVRIVVAVLGPTPLISTAEHRHALGKKQCREKIAALPVAQHVNVRIIGRTFDAAIPRLIIVVAVAVLVAVQLVVFFVVADQIGECESIMDCNEVDARVRPSAVMFIEIGASGKSIRHVTNTPFIALPKTADRVAIFAVPFRPGHRKVAHLIAAFPDIPRFCDQLHLREYWVLLNYLEKWMQRIESGVIARQFGCEIESKSVHMHFLHPVPQAVGHQL